jgi:dethiobiotin synthetase
MYLCGKNIIQMNFIIAGIHTGIGKTICSAVLAEALGYDYWKPVQAGDLDASDSIFVKNHISNTLTVIHPEAYRLTIPASPHYAAAQDGVEIQLNNLALPKSNNSIIVETAGGLMSPLSDTLLNIDLIKYLNLPVVLVTNDYLGSINHTLLSVEILRGANIEILGLVFSGQRVDATRSFIQNYTGLKTLMEIPYFESLDKEALTNFVNTIDLRIDEFYEFHES